MFHPEEYKKKVVVVVVVVAFHKSCLIKICNIYQPNVISNDELYQKTGCISINCEIKKCLL